MSPKPDARSENRGRHARRRWRELFDRVLPIIVSALVVLFIIVAVLSVIVFTNARNARTAAAKARVGVTKAEAALKRAKATATNGCERVQLVRDDVNVTSWGVYNALKMPRGRPDAAEIRRLLAAVDPATQRLIAALTAGGSSRPIYARIKDKQNYLPPTDCDIAADNPKYRFPRPLPFSAVASCYDPDANPRPRHPCARR